MCRVAPTCRSSVVDRIDTRKWAEAYGVTQRTLQRWVNSRQPVEYPTEMAKIILRDPRSSSESRAKAAAILNPGAVPSPGMAQMGSKPDATKPDPNYVDPDWAKVESEGWIEDDSLEEAKKQRAFYGKKLAAAQRVGSVADIDFYSRQYFRADEAHDRILSNRKKLGIDAGEMMKRETVERYLEAFAFVLMRGADEAIDHLAKECVGKSFPEEIRPALENYLLSTRLLRPFQTVVGQASALGLPPWFVEKLINVAADNIEGARDAIAASHRDRSLIPPEEAACHV